MTLTENSPAVRMPKWFWWALTALVAAGLALRAGLYATTDFTVGDAFITFRFAEQFAAGHGLVFNTGEVVGGNTSVLHSLLVGLGACTGAGVPLVARIEGILFDVAGLFFFWNILRGPGGLRSPVLQLFVLTAIFLCPFLFWYSVSGLETPLYLMMIFFLFDRTLKQVDWCWFLAVALLFFSRPDGIVAVVAALVCLLLKEKKLPWKAGIGVFAIGLAYLAYNYFVYHTVVPPTVKVKGIVYHCTAWDNVLYLTARFFLHRTWLFFGFLGVLGAVVLWRWKNPAVRLMGIAAFGYLLFLLAAPTLRTWYCAPFLALSGATLLLGICGAAEEFSLPRLNLIVPAVLVVYLAGSFFADRILFRDCKMWRERIHDLTEAEGEWFKANTPSDAKILVESLEVGWFCKRHTWDWPGLVSPNVLALVRENPQIGFFEISEKLKTDYVIIHQGWRGVDDTNVPPNYKFCAEFFSRRNGEAVQINNGKDFIYQRVSD